MRLRTTMKNKRKSIIAGAAVLLAAVSLGACSFGKSSQNDSSQTQQETVQSQKTVEHYYKKAIADLRVGANQQAYSELKKVHITSKTPDKVIALRRNTKRLVAAKKAITGNDLQTTKDYLNILDNVNRPQVLVTQIQAVQQEYQTVALANTYYDEVVKYYKAGKYSAAGGSLQALQSLSNKYEAVAALQSRAAKYGDLIAAKQSDGKQSSSSSAASSQSGTDAENSASASSASSQTGYANARSSKILSSQYSKRTGSNISSATNSEISSVASQVTDYDILQQFRAATGIPQEAGDQYFVRKLDGSRYQIEIRHTSESNYNVSNLKGMYIYNSKDKTTQKMDAVTGEYSSLR